MFSIEDVTETFEFWSQKLTPEALSAMEKADAFLKNLERAGTVFEESLELAEDKGLRLCGRWRKLDKGLSAFNTVRNGGRIPYVYSSDLDFEVEGVIYKDSNGRIHKTEGVALTIEDKYEPHYREHVITRIEFYVFHGVLQARVKTSDVLDCEGTYYKQEWFNSDGKLHREDGPAVIFSSDNYIPEETPLCKAYDEYWLDGVFKNKVDKTYQDLISKKPLVLQHASGWGYEV